MPKFYQTAAFRKLQREWRQKLNDDKFDDHELPNGKLRDHDRRTQAWEDRSQVLAFVAKLEDFLRENDELPDNHLAILQGYSQGMRRKELALQVGCNKATCSRVLKLYRKAILDQP